MPAVMKKRFLTVLVLLWMGLIFWFSAQPSDDSEDMSLEAGKLAGQILIPEYEEWSQARQLAFAKKIDLPVRKLAHGLEYAVLGLFLTAMYRSYGLDGRRWILISFLSAAAYASTDEFHQLFVPGRAGKVTDVLIDSAGALIGVCVVWMIRRRYILGITA